MSIIDRSEQAAERGDVWTRADHAALVAYAREIEVSYQRLIAYMTHEEAKR